MGIVLQFRPRPPACDEEEDGADARSAEPEGSLGQIIVFPGADFARVLPSLAALKAEFAALQEEPASQSDANAPRPAGA